MADSKTVEVRNDELRGVTTYTLREGIVVSAVCYLDDGDIVHADDIDYAQEWFRADRRRIQKGAKVQK